MKKVQYSPGDGPSIIGWLQAQIELTNSVDLMNKAKFQIKGRVLVQGVTKLIREGVKKKPLNL